MTKKQYTMANLNEIWLPVTNYEGIYEVSNIGRVRSLERQVLYTSKIRGVYLITVPYKIMKLTNRQGYRAIHLAGGKRGIGKKALVHRLVASAFIPNPNNYPVINHINSDKADNRVSNLEWCTQSHNNFHAYKYGFKKPVMALVGRIGKLSKLAKPVIQYSKDGEFIKEWDCAIDVEREINIAASSVGGCCAGKLKTAGNFIWRMKLI